MAKAFTLLDLFLECRVPECEECELTALCQEVVSSDIRQLFVLYHEKLSWIVREEDIGDLFDTWVRHISFVDE
jgi:hypothetical protein